ncbi:PAS domain-containing protein [Kiloniella litopenaei]|uniref:PAS domain-containing protein n=1 Tax=Kiloniella litopenaei TaxID=1549748 RepID=UPI0006973335|nr:PAS domain-containing protein [Kiloniella litopenaei]
MTATSNFDENLGLEATHLVELFRYWQSLLRVKELPARADIDPQAIPALLPYCELIDVHRDPLDFEYRLVGTLIDEIVTQSYTGLRLSEIPTQNSPSLMFSLYEQVTKEKRPVRSVLPYTGELPDIKDVESLVLPLSSNGHDVDMLLGGIALRRPDRDNY